jgi:NADH:quinone reductase (non-electrogenic)
MADGDHRVVVIGGGFGGLRAVRQLASAPVRITLVDRRNFHLFQPLSYQVATGALPPSEVAYPLRALFKRDRNVTVLLADVTGIDLQARQVALTDVSPGETPPDPLEYDTLIVAAGSSYSYFGHEEWREHAAEVKSLESAVTVRSRLLSAFERAEISDDPAEQAAQLTFVVVGAGPTGVEMAGQIAELARDTLRADYRRIDPTGARVLLVETADRLLTTFPESLSAKAARSLEKIGVTPMLNRTVVGMDADSVTLQAPDDSSERIAARTVVWAAGVRASGLAGMLGRAAGADIDRAGRVTIEPDLTLPGHPEVMVLGDMAAVRKPEGGVQQLPGVAPVAIQQGTYAGRAVRRRLAGETVAPFRYHDKGNVATIGRGRAVAEVGFLRLSGLPAWLVWFGVHIFYLIGFRNRLLVLMEWTFSFISHGRSSRLIVDTPAEHEPPT